MKNKRWKIFHFFIVTISATFVKELFSSSKFSLPEIANTKSTRIDHLFYLKVDPGADYKEGRFPKLDEAIRNAKRGKR